MKFMARVIANRVNNITHKLTLSTGGPELAAGIPKDLGHVSKSALKDVSFTLRRRGKSPLGGTRSRRDIAPRTRWVYMTSGPIRSCPMSLPEFFAVSLKRCENFIRGSMV